jgi:type IV fimbrial biogenesis protein FimT
VRQLTRRAAGFSLIELMVTITLIGIMLAVGIPAFGKWTADAKVRATAESLTNALRTARANAIANNRTTMLVLTAGTPAANATPVATGPNWFVLPVVLIGSGETSAGISQASTQATQANVQIGASAGVPSSTAAPAVTCFNGLGQQATLTATQTGLSLGCTSGQDAYWVTSASATRQYEVVVAPGGQIRMCDALKSQSNNNPDGC